MESSNIGHADILLDQAKDLIKSARTFYIWKGTDIKLMSKDKLKTYLRSNWTDYEEKAHNLMHISYAIRKLSLHLPPSYQQRCTYSIIDLEYYSSLITSTISMIIEEGEIRKIKLTEDKFNLLTLKDAPKFTGTIYPYHFFEFENMFLQFLETADISLHESGPLWMKSLEGLAKTTMERIHPGKYIPEVGSIIQSLKSIFGQPSEILLELLSEHRNFGPIPSYIGNTNTDWKMISKKAIQHKILLKKLSSLPILHAAIDIEDTLEYILPLHQLETFKLKTKIGTSIENKIKQTLQILDNIEEFSEKQQKKSLYGQSESDSDEQETTTEEDFEDTEPEIEKEPLRFNNWFDSDLG